MDACFAGVGSVSLAAEHGYFYKLSSLPGVYDMDTRSLTRAHGSLRQLAMAGQAALASSIPAQRAEKLHAFLHGTSHGTADKQPSD